MEPSELELILKAAFLECDRKLCPLSDRQKTLVLKTVLDCFSPLDSAASNPLDELNDEQRTQLLTFIQNQAGDASSWKIALLNDWLNERDSGSVQFIREKYGFSWLNRVQPIHLEPYLPEVTPSLTIGDRIEVSSRLWEWAQAEQSGDSEWIGATVVGLKTGCDRDTEFAIAIVRFANGSDYEIPGIYEWNRYNWRQIEEIK